MFKSMTSPMGIPGWCVKGEKEILKSLKPSASKSVGQGLALGTTQAGSPEKVGTNMELFSRKVIFEFEKVQSPSKGKILEALSPPPKKKARSSDVDRTGMDSIILTVHYLKPVPAIVGQTTVLVRPPMIGAVTKQAADEEAAKTEAAAEDDANLGAKKGSGAGAKKPKRTVEVLDPKNQSRKKYLLK